MVQESFASAEGAVEECSLRRFSSLDALKRHFHHSQADSCVKKVPKIDRYLAKYDSSYLRRTKTCTVYFYLLFIYAPRVYNYLAGKKIGH